MSSYSELLFGNLERVHKSSDVDSKTLKVLTNAMSVMISAKAEFISAFRDYKTTGDPDANYAYKYNIQELDRALRIFGKNVSAIVEQEKFVADQSIAIIDHKREILKELIVPSVQGNSYEEALAALEETRVFREAVREVSRKHVEEDGDSQYEWELTAISVFKTLPSHTFLGELPTLEVPNLRFSGEVLPESPNSASYLLNACGLKFGNLNFLRHCRVQYSISVDGATVVFPSTFYACSISNVLNDLLDSFAIPRLNLSDLKEGDRTPVRHAQLVGKLLNLNRRPINLPTIDDAEMADFILSSQAIKVPGLEDIVSCGRVIVPENIGAFIRSIFPLQVKMWQTDFVLPNSLEETKVVQSFCALLACAVQLQTATSSVSLSEAFHGANAILHAMLDGVPKSEVYSLIETMAYNCASIMTFWFGFVFNDSYRVKVERSAPVSDWYKRVDLALGILFWKPIMGLVPYISDETPQLQNKRNEERANSTICTLTASELVEARLTLKTIQRELHNEVDIVNIYFTVSTFLKEVTSRMARLSRLNQTTELDAAPSRSCLARPPQLLSFVAASLDSRPSELITTFCHQGVLRHFKAQEIYKVGHGLKQDKLIEIFKRSNDIVSKAVNFRHQGVEEQLLRVSQVGWDDKAKSALRKVGELLMMPISDPRKTTVTVVGSYGIGSLFYGGFHAMTATTQLASVGTSVVAVYTTSMVWVGLVSIAAALFIGVGGVGLLTKSLTKFINLWNNANAVRVQSGFPDFITEVCPSEVEEGAFERGTSALKSMFAPLSVAPGEVLTNVAKNAISVGVDGAKRAASAVGAAVSKASESTKSTVRKGAERVASAVSNAAKPAIKIVTKASSALWSLLEQVPAPLAPITPEELGGGIVDLKEFTPTEGINPYPIILAVGDTEVRAVGNNDRGVTQVASFISSYDAIHCNWQVELSKFAAENAKSAQPFGDEFSKELQEGLRNIMTLCFFKAIVPVELPHASALLHALVENSLVPAINLTSETLKVTHKRAAELLSAQMLVDASKRETFKFTGGVVPVTVTPNSRTRFVFGVPLCRPMRERIRTLQAFASTQVDQLREIIVENPKLHLTNILNFAICAMKNASANPALELDSQRYAAVVLATIEDEFPELRDYIATYIHANINGECVKCGVKNVTKQIGLTSIKHREISVLSGLCEARGGAETKEKEDGVKEAIDTSQSNQAVNEVMSQLVSTCGVPLSSGAMLHIRRRFQAAALSDTSPTGVLQGMVHTLGRFEWTSLFQIFQTEYIQRQVFKTRDALFKTVDGKGVASLLDFFEEIKMQFGSVQTRALVLHIFIHYIDTTATCAASCGNLLTPFIMNMN